MTHVGRWTDSGLLASRRHVSVQCQSRSQACLGAGVGRVPPPLGACTAKDVMTETRDQPGRARRTLGSAALQPALDFLDLFWGTKSNLPLRYSVLAI